MNQTSNYINKMNEKMYQTFLKYHSFQETNFVVDVVEILYKVFCLEIMMYKFFGAIFFSVINVQL